MNTYKDEIIQTKSIEDRRKKDIETIMPYFLGLPIGLIGISSNGAPDSFHAFFSIMFALSIYSIANMVERLGDPIFTGKHRSQG